MIVYTRIQDPRCSRKKEPVVALFTITPEHTAAPKDPPYHTHMEALNNYQHSLRFILDEPSTIRGNKSWDRLKGSKVLKTLIGTTLPRHSHCGQKSCAINVVVAIATEIFLSFRRWTNCKPITQSCTFQMQ